MIAQVAATNSVSVPDFQGERELQTALARAAA
jgi:hypothetical protein